MASFQLDSFSTALVLLPPPHIQTRINLLRSANDKAHPRWTAHITLIYPFTTNPDALPCVQAKVERANLTPFELILDAVGRFESRGYKTIYLGQSLRQQAGHGELGSTDSDSHNAVHRLHTLLADALGYRGRPFVPHMTLGQTSHREEEDINRLESKARWLLQSGSINWSVGSIAVLQKDDEDGGRMKLIDQVPLIGSTGIDKTLIASDNAFSYHYYPPDRGSWTPTLLSQVAHISSKGLCVLTLNILHHPQHPSLSRYSDILSLLLTIDADFVCLQEVSDDFMSILLHDTQVHNRWSWSTRDPDTPMESERNIIVLAKEHLPFSWKRIPLGEKHKAATVLTLDVFQSESNSFVKLVLAAIHLTAGLTPKHLETKTKEFLTLIQYLQQHHADDEWIIAGDTNFPSDHTPPSVEALLADAWQIKHGSDASGVYSATYDPERNVLAAQSARAERSPCRYDRIYTKRRSAIVLDSIVLCDESLMPPVSDHYPLYVRLSLPRPSSTGATPSYDASVASSILQYSKPVSSSSACSSSLRGQEDHSRAASDFSLMAFAQEEGVIPDANHDAQREAAIEALCRVIGASRERGAEKGLVQKDIHGSGPISMPALAGSSVKFILIPVGSFAMNVHFKDSDIDCIVVGNISPASFWVTTQQKLSRQRVDANEALGPIVLKRFVKDAATQMMVLGISKFKVDMQYCPAANLAENWPKQMDEDILLPVSSLRVLNAHRDRIRLEKAIPSFDSFQLAYRSIKLFCIRSGIYSSRFGFLGGIHLTILLHRIVTRLPSSTSASDLVKEFFRVYSSFNWASEIAFVADTPINYKRSAREPIVILSPQRPVINVAANASFFTRQTIVKELRRAYESLDKGISWPQVCKSEAKSISEFLNEYSDFVKMDVGYWGGSCMEARALLGFIESRIVHLLVELYSADYQMTARLWPDRLTDLPTDSKTASVQGFYLCGIQRLPKESGSKPLIGILHTFEDSVRKNASYFDASTCFFSATECKRTQVFSNGQAFLLVDRPLWKDDEIDDPLDVEEDRDGEALPTESVGASHWEEARGDLEFNAVNHSAAKKQRRAAKNSGATQQTIQAERLRTSADVYNRLLWDPIYDEADYLIGYEDRFLGIKEMPLKSWSREVDDETFIPFHRVMHFRCKSTGEIVWDRLTKVDQVFGSGATSLSG